MSKYLGAEPWIFCSGTTEMLRFYGYDTDKNPYNKCEIYSHLRLHLIDRVLAAVVIMGEAPTAPRWRSSIIRIHGTAHTHELRQLRLPDLIGRQMKQLYCSVQDTSPQAEFGPMLVAIHPDELTGCRCNITSKIQQQC
jgi:hypothetical protein